MNIQLFTKLLEDSLLLYFYFAGMLASKTRNYSVKTLYHPKTDRKDEDEPVLLKAKPGKLLPTIAENRDLQKTQAKELSINIKKFQNMLSAKGAEPSGQETIRAAYFVVKSFGEVDSNFKEVFSELHLKLKDFLFLGDAQISFKYKLKEGVTYRKTCRNMEKMNNEWLRQKDERIAQLEGDVLLKEQDGNNQIEALNVECFRLRGEVEKYKKIANAEYVRSLEKKIEDMKETISTQEEDYKVLAKKNEESSLEIEQLRREVSELQVNCSLLEEKVHDMSIIREKTELYLLNTKDRFDQLKNRLDAMKMVIAKVESQNETLVAERAKLVNRAAVSFEDLTPRPKYAEYFCKDEGTNMNSTAQIFQGLLQALPGPKPAIFERYFLAKKNRKLMQCQAIREKTVRELMAAKSQINKIG